MKLKSLILIIIVFFIYSNLFGNETIKEIRKIYYGTNKLIETEKISPLCFVNVQIDDKWQYLGCDVTLNDYTGWYAEYQVFIHNKKLVKLREISSSSSGDWSDTTDYYFHPNSYTAFIFQHYRTFLGFLDSDIDEKTGHIKDETEDRESGIFIIERRLYYNESAKLIRDLRNNFYEISENNKRISLKNDRMKYDDPSLYENLKSIPIYEHLKTKNLIN